MTLANSSAILSMSACLFQRVGDTFHVPLVHFVLAVPLIWLRFGDIPRHPRMDALQRPHRLELRRLDRLEPRLAGDDLGLVAQARIDDAVDWGVLLIAVAEVVTVHHLVDTDHRCLYRTLHVVPA